MRVKDILKISALTLQNDEILACLNGEDSSEEAKKEVEKMFSCFKLVVSELCEEYLPVTKTETFSSLGGIIYFKDFLKTPLEIKSVYQNGNEVDFSVTPLYLKTEKGSVEVVYEYYPEILSIEEECPYSQTKISDRIIALGVAREYTLILGLFDEAISFDERFQKALSSVLFPKNLKRIKVRGWF